MAVVGIVAILVTGERSFLGVCVCVCMETSRVESSKGKISH